MRVSEAGVMARFYLSTKFYHMKDIIIKSIHSEADEISFDVIKTPLESTIYLSEMKTNFHYNGRMLIEFTTSGDFSGMTRKDVEDFAAAFILFKTKS